MTRNNERLDRVRERGLGDDDGLDGFDVHVGLESNGVRAIKAGGAGDAVGVAVWL